MRQKAKPLTAQRVKTARHSGTTKYSQRLHDGGARTGLSLNIQPGGTKSWVQAIVIDGHRRAMGLGRYPQVSLAEARRLAEAHQACARDGGDPRRPKVITPRFHEAAQRYIDRQASAWRSPITKRQWESSLATYAYPIIGDMRVNSITSRDVLAVLRPIWESRRETAQRLRRRISAVMETMIVEGHCHVDPAGKHVLKALPRARPRTRHFRSLHYGDVPAALATVWSTGAWIGTKLALEFLVLTAARSGEVRGATWPEIDRDSATWTIPASRMKGSEAHRVPLSHRALEILAEARHLTDPPLTEAHRACTLVFPSARGKIMSDNTLSKLLRDKRIACVPHGFRSSFRVWASEHSDVIEPVLEAALAHKIPYSTMRAYARSDLFDRRRTLMQEWAAFVHGAGT